MTSLCRHSCQLSAQEIVNWVTTADGCVHTADTTQLDSFVASASAVCIGHKLTDEIGVLIQVRTWWKEVEKWLWSQLESTRSLASSLLFLERRRTQRKNRPLPTVSSHITSHFITSTEEGGYVLTSVCLSVCLSVRRITEKVVNGTKRINFGDDADHCPNPGVWSPKSGFIGLSKKYLKESDQSCIANLHSKIIHQFYYAGVRRRSVLSGYF